MGRNGTAQTPLLVMDMDASLRALLDARASAESAGRTVSDAPGTDAGTTRAIERHGEMMMSPADLPELVEA
jgi:hypothetical protein